MNLPNYFLIDLPPQTDFSPMMLREACQALRRNRDKYLAQRTTEELVHLFSELAEDWLRRDFPFRRMAINEGSEQTGFSKATIERGLDDYFKHLHAAELYRLIEQDLGHKDRLDRFAKEHAGGSARKSFAKGPELLVHITGGDLPNPIFTSIVIGFLLRSAQFVKCPSGASALPRLFVHSIYEKAPKLASCLEIAEWTGGKKEIERALFDEADCVAATGSDETLDAIRRLVPSTTRFIGHGHRVSFGFICKEMLAESMLQDLLTAAARDITAWDQLGCLSPHLFYVEHGGEINSEQFAELLAHELAVFEVKQPRGIISAQSSADIAYRRSFYEMRAANTAHTRVWQSNQSTAWTVVHESDPLFQMSCLNRFVHVKGAVHLTHALQGADGIRKHVSTVGLEAPASRREELAIKLAQWGASRVCPVGVMQDPPLLWRHDGRPSLADLVDWVDLE